MWKFINFNSSEQINSPLRGAGRGAALYLDLAERSYLQIEHPYEVGALKVVLDKTHHAGVLRAPHGGTVRQGHKQLCHGGGHGLDTQTANATR